MVLNPGSKVNVYAQESFFRPKTLGTKAGCGTRRCRDEGGIQLTQLPASFSVQRFANVPVRPCLQMLPLERTPIALCPHYHIFG